MRMLNSVLTRVLAAGLALDVWGHAMLHVAKLRPSDDSHPHDLRLAA
jgi:hypothetical protein